MATSMMDVLRALASGRPQDALGCPEGRDIDFKRAPYVLDELKGRWELAKDVAAFANTGSGLIVVGYRTKREPTKLTEVASEVRPVGKSLVNADKYRDCIANLVTPLVERVEMRWYPDDESEEGIFTVFVPSQADRRKPFLLRKNVHLDGGEVTAFSVPIRNEDRTEWYSADQIQAQLGLATLLARGGTAAAAGPSRTDLDDGLTDLVRELEALEEPVLGLQLVPKTTVDLMGELFRRDGITNALSKWEGIRRMGFDLESAHEPEPRGDSVLFGGGRWRGRVAADGVVEVVIPVRSDFLCWAMKPPPLRVNAVPLVEVSYDFFRLATRVVADRRSHVSWQGRVRAWRMKEGGVQLCAGRVPWYDWESPSVATRDDYVSVFDSTSSPEQDAFAALTRTYAIWGLGPDAIPFARDQAVVPSEIIAI